MLDDDRDLLRAMSKFMDAPTQQPGPDVRLVIRRGRRRMHVRRMGGVVGAFGMVGVTLFAMNGILATTPTSPIGAAGTTTSIRPLSDDPAAQWIPVPFQPRTPTSTWAPAPTAQPPAGREILKTPICRIEPGLGDGDNIGTVPVPAGLLRVLATATEAQVRPATTSHVQSATLNPASGKQGAKPMHFNWIDISDSGGIGSIELRTGTFIGTPRQRADAEAFLFGNCAPPDRIELDDGTIAQAYSVVPSDPFQSLTLPLRIYRPDGTLHQLRLLNFGSSDFHLQGDGAAFERTGTGRATLPISSAQLREIGLSVARHG